VHTHALSLKICGIGSIGVSLLFEVTVSTITKGRQRGSE